VAVARAGERLRRLRTRRLRSAPQLYLARRETRLACLVFCNSIFFTWHCCRRVF
jgi:hypothetical protein